MLYVISYYYFSENPIQVKTTDRFAFVDEICRMTGKSCGDVAYWVDKLSVKAAESDSGMADDCAVNDTFIFAIAGNDTVAERANLSGLKLDEMPDIKGA